MAVEQLEYGALDQEAIKIIELHLLEMVGNKLLLENPNHPFDANYYADGIVRYLWQAGFHIQRHNEYPEQQEIRQEMIAGVADYTKAA